MAIPRIAGGSKSRWDFPLLLRRAEPMYLSEIVDYKKKDPRFHEARDTDWEEMLELMPASPKRSLSESLRATPAGEPAIIAEMKRASPSKGSFDFKSSVSRQVAAYQAGGARAVSVLTNERFFQGTLDDLAEAKKSCDLPILRKDFLTESWEITQAKCYGADFILLIAAILYDNQMEAMVQKAHKLGLEVLIEVHDEAELERVLHMRTAPEAIGINNRNLRTFEVTLETTARLAAALPKEILRVSESGFASRSDLLRFDGMVDAFLIGETLMRSTEPEQTLRGWVKG